MELKHLNFEHYKKHCYNFSSYKWSVNKFVKYIKSREYISREPEHFIREFENSISDYYREYPGSKGYVSAKKFVNTLRRSSKLETPLRLKKFRLKNDFDKAELLALLKEANRLTSSTDKKMIEHIFEHFELGVKKSTLERLYRDS